MEDIALILEDYADALHKYGRDILQGDFGVFPILDRRVRNRAEKMDSYMSD
jgi:hypothetical protein